MEKFFNITGWIVGIISFIFINKFFLVSIESFGIVTYIGPYAEEGSRATDIELFFLILSIVLATGLGNIIHSRNFPPFSSTNHGKITYATLLVFSLLVSMTGFFVLIIVGPDFGTWINLGLSAIFAYFGFQYVTSLPRDE